MIVFVEVCYFEELEGGFFGICFEKVVFSCVVIVIDMFVLFVECFI